MFETCDEVRHLNEVAEGLTKTKRGLKRSRCPKGQLDSTWELRIGGIIAARRM